MAPQSRFQGKVAKDADNRSSGNMYNDAVLTMQSKLISRALDVQSDQSISAAVLYIQQNYGVWDVLINNAGASFEQAIAQGTRTMTLREGFNKDWDVKITDAHQLTQAMMPSVSSQIASALSLGSSRSALSCVSTSSIVCLLDGFSL